MRPSVLVLVVLAAVGGCATGGGSAATAPRNRDVITTEEITRASATNAYELVKSLRPNWLNTRGEHSFRESGIDVLIIYLDNARLGGAETLRQVPVPTVTSLKYFDAKAATFKWGAGHAHGAILVSTAPPATALLLQ